MRVAGQIFYFAGSSAPAGALACNGQEISKTTYPELWAALGTTWDTCNGAATPSAGNFRLPPQANGTNGLFYVGKTGGGGVGTFINEQNVSHTHTTTLTSGGAHTDSIQRANSYSVGGSGNTGTDFGSGYTPWSGYAGTHSHTVTLASTGSVFRPQSVVFLMCIWTGQ